MPQMQGRWAWPTFRPRIITSVHSQLIIYPNKKTGLCRGTCIEVTVLRAWLEPAGLAPERGVLTDSAPPLLLRKKEEEKKKNHRKVVAHFWAEYHMHAMPLPSSCGNTRSIFSQGCTKAGITSSGQRVLLQNNHAVPLILSSPIQSRCASTSFFSPPADRH